jgi:phosphatidylglycerophosphatase C
MKISFFDFDVTVTKEDSLIKFIRFAAGDMKTAWGMLFLLPMLIKYKLKTYTQL